MKVLNKISKGGKMLKPLLRSKVLLYFLSILSILNILFFGYIKDYQSVFAFIIIALLMSFFSKNMIVILFIAIALSNLIKFALHRRYEGLDNMKKKENMEDMEEQQDITEEEALDDLEASFKDVIDEDAKKIEKQQEKEAADAEVEEKKALYNDLKNDMVEFEELQRNIMNNMKEIDPLLTKAETFVEKFEGYKKKLT
tara:strand:+ start:328 stop:921 length:594 start_codon:yes stop_codon:yes gene_type:complete